MIVIASSAKEMEKIRGWALNRHERSKTEDNSNWKHKLFQGGSFFNNDIDPVAETIFSVVLDKMQNGRRNEQIGKLKLKADAGSWDFFMELIEKWEKFGGSLAVHSGYVLLTSAGPEKAVLAALHPGSMGADSWICLRWYGLENRMASAEKINNYHIDVNLTASGQITGMYKLININETIGLVDAREYLRALMKLYSLQVIQKKG